MKYLTGISKNSSHPTPLIRCRSTHFSVESISFKETLILHSQPVKPEHPSSHSKKKRPTPPQGTVEPRSTKEPRFPLQSQHRTACLLATLNDKLKQHQTVTLAQVASSPVGGCFFHVFPWSVVKEAFEPWVNAPREAFPLELRACQKTVVSFLV